MDRLGGAAGHAKFICPLCKMQAPSLKNMEEHHEVTSFRFERENYDFRLTSVEIQSKHDGIPFDPTACENAHTIHGGSTKGIFFFVKRRTQTHTDRHAEGRHA